MTTVRSGPIKANYSRDLKSTLPPHMQPSISSPDRVLARAFAAHQAGNAGEAEFLYKLVLQADPRQFDALHMLAIIEGQRGNFAGGLRHINQALRIRPNSVDALINLGLMQSKVGDNAGALAAYKRALAIHPQCALAHSNMSAVLRQLGQGEDAITHCETALALAPGYADAWNNRGNALVDLKRPLDALASYDRAIALRPKRAESHLGRGNALRQLLRHDEAHAAYNRALVLEPDNPQTLCSVGVVLMDMDRLDEAEAKLRRAIKVDPNFAAAYNNLGLILKERGRLGDARFAIEQAIHLSPNNTSYYDNLGAVRSFAAADHYVAALEGLAENAAALRSEDRIHLHFALAKAYEDGGRYEGAFRHLLAGNELKRRQVTYDEAVTLARLARTRQLFSRDFIASRQGAGEPATMPVFVVGMPRSGTSLIEQILASHPEVFGAGELGLFEQTVDAVGNMLPGALRFPELASGLSSQHFRTIGARFCEALKRGAPTASRIVDKMPANFLFVGLIHLSLPNAAIIHAIRDPIDTCLSCFSTHFSRGQAHTYDLAELGRYYRHYQALMAHWQCVLPPRRIIDVHYEKLVGDLEGVSRRIVAHCGLAWDARCLDFHRTERLVRTASAVQVRQPIYKSSVGRWRRYENFLAPLVSALKPSDAPTVQAGAD
jgi:tetratricopeptide (TPR) repeat protein